MANYILQELPEEMGDGKKPIYPKMQVYTLHDFDTVIKHMRDYSGSFSEGTIRGVVDALIETMKSWLPMGHTIKIDGLGVFSLSLAFDTNTPSEKALTKEQAENDNSNPKTRYRHVCIKSVRFKPDPTLIQEMNRQNSFERAESDVRVPRKTALSRKGRIKKALEVISKNGYMTLSDYAQATGQSRTSASKDLKVLSSDPASGISERGSHSHKVWVARKDESDGTIG